MNNLDCDKRLKGALDKVLTAIAKDKSLLCRYSKTQVDSTDITAENLADLAGNHLFDDEHDLLGITELEGYAIRAYFQTSEHFIEELHETYPDIMSKESDEYIESIHRQRRTNL